MEGRRAPLALYADDWSFFAKLLRRLMSLLRTLREWSEAVGLTVNARKCELLFFHPSDQVRRQMYALSDHNLITMRVLEEGQPVLRPVTWKAGARYLGLHAFRPGPESAFVSCTDELFSAGHAAGHVRSDQQITPAGPACCYRASA